MHTPPDDSVGAAPVQGQGRSTPPSMVAASARTGDDAATPRGRWRDAKTVRI